MSDIDKRLDEILENILHNYAMNLHEYSNGIWGHHNDYREQTDATKQIIKQLMVDEFNNILNFIDTDTNDVCWKHSPNDNPMIHASRIEYLTEYVDQKLKELKK